jgi:hypothetical protein
MRAPRRRPEVQPEAEISDTWKFHRLIRSGHHGYDTDDGFWAKHAPHLAASVRIRVSNVDRSVFSQTFDLARQQQLERVHFLIDKGFLSGNAAQSAEYLLHAERRRLEMAAWRT